MIRPRCWLSTPGGAAGLAIIEVRAPDAPGLTHLLQSIGIRDVGVGHLRLRPMADIDTGLVARWSETVCQLMPHGSRPVIDAILKALQGAGCEVGGEDLLARYPEAHDRIDACVLDAMAIAASPAAIDVLLEHAQRWRGASPDERAQATDHLRHLRDPARVVAIGAPNIGKSSLLNALAGRAASITADEPGTTRDHVGVTLDLGGVVVQWADLPGWTRAEPDAIVAASQRAAATIAAAADVVVLCADGQQGWIEPEDAGCSKKATIIRCGLRADLGETSGADLQTSAVEHRGLDMLAQAVRRAVLPRGAEDRLWRFHPGLLADR
ncbi:MAG: GTPase [Planctomycetota bacterium]